MSGLSFTLWISFILISGHEISDLSVDDIHLYFNYCRYNVRYLDFRKGDFSSKFLMADEPF